MVHATQYMERAREENGKQEKRKEGRGSGSRYKREVQGNYGFRSSLSVEVITTLKNLKYLFIFKVCFRKR